MSTATVSTYIVTRTPAYYAHLRHRIAVAVYKFLSVVMAIGFALMLTGIVLIGL